MSCSRSLIAILSRTFFQQPNAGRRGGCEILLSLSAPETVLVGRPRGSRASELDSCSAFVTTFVPVNWIAVNPRKYGARRK